jgi:hypothetical protein
MESTMRPSERPTAGDPSSNRVVKYMLACPLENATTVAVAFETTQSMMMPHGSVGAKVAARQLFRG